MSMGGTPSIHSRYQSLRASRRVLARSAPLVRFGLFSVGVGLFLDQVRPLVSDAQFTWGERRVMGLVALITIGGFGIAGWLAGRLLRASAELIDVFVDGAEAAGRTADLIELQLVPTLVRLAGALERPTVTATVAAAAAAAPAVGSSPGDEARQQTLSAFRRALGAGRWSQAERLAQAFLRDFPNAPESATLDDELTRARQEASDALRDRLESARRANDPDRVIDLRDALTEHLRGEPLRKLDRDLVHWLVGLIQERLKAGPARPDVAALAARVADSFGDTPEGASLRAALPNLRRSAGLCPRCGRPSPGRAEACPRCLADGTSPSSRAIPEPVHPEPEAPP
jgi:hypothetical protein